MKLFLILFLSFSALGPKSFAAPTNTPKLEYLFSAIESDFFRALDSMGWRNAEKLKIGNLYLLCSEMKCPYILKIMNPDLSETEVFKILNIQIHLSKKDLAPPLLYYGRILSPTGPSRIFVIGELGLSMDRCPEPRRSKAELIEALAEEGIIHGDLEFGNANIVCVRNKLMAIDFDFATNITELSPQEQKHEIEIERLCTLYQEMSRENMAKLSLQDKFIYSVYLHNKKEHHILNFMNICICRKAKRDRMLMKILVDENTGFRCD